MHEIELTTGTPNVAGLTCADLVDAMGRLHRYNLQNLFYEAVGDEPQGKVLVLASNGHTDVSMGGGTKLSRLQNHGCAGVLTDGRLRDRRACPIRVRGLLLWRSHQVGWRGGHPVPGERAGGRLRRWLFPGFYIFADSSGAVVIPEGQVEDVVEGARKVEAEDDGDRADIRQEPLPPTPQDG